MTVSEVIEMLKKYPSDMEAATQSNLNSIRKCSGCLSSSGKAARRDHRSVHCCSALGGDCGLGAFP
jgi:hypothetical protein